MEGKVTGERVAEAGVRWGPRLLGERVSLGFAFQTGLLLTSHGC